MSFMDRAAALAGWLLVEVGFTFAATEPESYGEDRRWRSCSRSGHGIQATCSLRHHALLGGSTFVGFSARIFPPWFRSTGVVFLALMLVIVAVLRAPGLAAAPGTLRITLASVYWQPIAQAA